MEQLFNDQKCFVIHYEQSHERMTVHFFETHVTITSCYGQYWEPNVRIVQHKLTLEMLYTIKYFHCVRGIESAIEYFESNRDKFVVDCKRITNQREKLKLELVLLKDYNEKLQQENQKLKSERKAFEKEKQELEQELAKYKSIVSNCQKEIKAYGL